MISVPKYRSNFDVQHFYFCIYALCYLDYVCLRIKNQPVTYLKCYFNIYV